MRFRVGLFTDRRLSVVCRRGVSPPIWASQSSYAVEPVTVTVPGEQLHQTFPGWETLFDVGFLIVQFLPLAAAFYSKFRNVNPCVSHDRLGRELDSYFIHHECRIRPQRSLFKTPQLVVVDV